MFSFWDLYSIVYDSLPDHFQPYQLLVKEVVSEVAKGTPKGKVLDAGCGTGNFTLALAKKGYEVVGIDASPLMLKRVVFKQKKNGMSNITVFKSDLEQVLDFPDNYFDTLICIHALYSLKNPDKVVKEYYRILRPNGYFIMCEPQYQIKLKSILKDAKIRGGWKEIMNVLFHFSVLGVFNYVLGKKQSKGMYHYWSENEARNTLVKNGFNVESVKPAYAANADILINSRKETAYHKQESFAGYDTKEAIISSV
jgi:ubiquinone/menaquinone biosynthesis C-methylase UbiE